MKFTRDEIRKAMLLYAVTDQMWLKDGEKLGDVVESVLKNGATFLQIETLIISGIMYLCLTTAVSKLVGMYERRLAVSD